MLERIDAKRCASCHAEHRPKATRAMTVTLPADFCVACHADVENERPSHAGFQPAGCASTGCHRYHDNGALYEDFIARHLNEPDTRPTPVVPLRNLRATFMASSRIFGTPLTRAASDAPKSAETGRFVDEWERSSHARAGVNCRGCHAPRGTPWDDRPKASACKGCHEPEWGGFLSGRHGMRLERGLSAMQPSLARLPMKRAAEHAELGCNSCHRSHAFDTGRAAVEGCLGCHDDRHSRSYAGSAHERLWRDERAGRAAPGTGVSCATCHLPRTTLKQHGKELVHVQHNQNDNLRPNDKFVRSVCLTCHGLGFSFDALADDNLVMKNFNGRPATRVKSLAMVKQRQGGAR
jgi:predicted CXXCH cytochrome family protein